MTDAIWDAAKRAIVDGDDAALERLLREHEQFFRENAPPPYVPQGPGPEYDPRRHAREIIANEQQFANWEEFAAFDRHSPFENAVEAIISGDAETLQRLLRDDPDLVRARSPREHHSTLLHYVGANGVEGFRQKTPKNAVEIATILLDAGSEIDAHADMYGGGSTTLALVATSVHPALAGVQDDLIEMLVARGAKIDDPRDINACLANGRFAAAQTLRRLGAAIDAEGAAGLGDIELLERLPATEEQLLSGLQWACEYGRAEMVEHLIARGVDCKRIHRGQTPLHWAACGGYVEIVRILLAHGAPTDVRDERYDGTPLRWAEYCRDREFEKVIELLRSSS